MLFYLISKIFDSKLKLKIHDESQIEVHMSMVINKDLGRIISRLFFNGLEIILSYGLAKH
jgi:hypothetical protein